MDDAGEGDGDGRMPTPGLRVDPVMLCGVNPTPSRADDPAPRTLNDDVDAARPTLVDMPRAAGTLACDEAGEGRGRGGGLERMNESSSDCRSGERMDAAVGKRTRGLRWRDDGRWCIA